MTIQIWSDIACPFCYIGKHHLMKALDSFQGGLEATIIWRSFELNPYAPVDTEEDFLQTLANKYGQTYEWAVNSVQSMAEKGRQTGLHFDFDHYIPTNTFDAHRLLHLAKSHGKGDELKEALFEAHFGLGRHIGKHDELIEIASGAGLDKQEALTVLSSFQFEDEVRKDEETARQYRITGVPFFVIDDKYGISGAQPVERFMKVLTEASTVT